MALNKVPVNINFSQGLDLKTDPWQVTPGKFLALQNTIFDKGGQLKKRNGFGSLETLPDNSPSTSLATHNGNLLALSTNLEVLSADTAQWLSRGSIQPVSVETLPVARSATNQTSCDVAIAPNNLACVTFLDGTLAYYQIVDSITGGIVVPRTLCASASSMPRCFVLGRNFVIVFLATVAGTPHMQYIAIPLANPTSPGTAVDISTTVKSITTGWDGIVANNNLYISYNGSDMGGAVRIVYLNANLGQSNTTIVAGQEADRISVTADVSTTTPTIWISYWTASSTDGHAMAYSHTLINILAHTQILTGVALATMTSTAVNNVLTVFYETTKAYSYVSTNSNYLSKVTITIAASIGTPAVMVRSLGLGSKAVYVPSKAKSYMLGAFGSSFQPTYFLIDSTGALIAKTAYSNGGGYAANQILPQVNVAAYSLLPSGATSGYKLSVGFLFKDLLTSVNKTQGVANTAGIYTQTGVNLAKYTLDTPDVNHAEIGGSLHITGGYVEMYDGVKPVEHGFHVWPDDTKVTTAATGGFLADQQYFYVATYEWTDAVGNTHRSAPSVPYGIVTAGGNVSANTVNVPYLRLTQKVAPNQVRIVIYRWSTAQQNYYQITSITSPQLNNPAADSLAFVDTLADASILGNQLLYTTGGVAENIAAPSCTSTALFKSRVFVIDAEDQNLLWYSKQVIEATPVEFSDLFTLYVAPTTAAQGNTGPMLALSAMDDKLIIFKQDAIYYLTGTGPDNAGANNDFSEPTFIASTVGCANPQSIVFMPNGLMFQSDKGIWLLDRNLQTTYIGSPVEEFNDASVVSAINIPGTNQVRFVLDSGITLMYDYFYGQWGSFINIPAQSSTLYQGLHTYLNSLGQVFQETPGRYLDGTNPVLMSFKTAWFNMAGLQGYERAYFLYLLGAWLSPHTLSVGMAYDYNPQITQTVLFTPDNFNPIKYGGDSLYGGSSVYGGSAGNVEAGRIFLKRQKCESVQITVSENFDSTKGVMAGAGLTMSGLNFIIGLKKGYNVLKPSKSFG